MPISSGYSKNRKAFRQAQGSTNMSLEDHSDSFHISIAWTLVEPSIDNKKRIALIDFGKLGGISIHFNSVKMKIGNHVVRIPLPAKVIEGKGFGGL